MTDPMTPDIAALVERLTRVVDTGRRTVGGGTISTPDGFASTWGNEPIIALANPDGPAAADALTRLSADAARVGELEAALRPFARMGQLLEGPFALVLFKDDQPIGMGGAWSQNGVTRTITYGDLRRACAALQPASSEGEGKPCG